MNQTATDKIRAYLQRLRATPGRELGNWARFMRFQVQLWPVCARRLWKNNVMAMSAALSFRTIFALVPILALSFLMLKSVGALEASKTQLRRFLETSGFDRIAIQPETVASYDGPLAPEAGESEVIDVASEIEAVVARVENQLTLGRVGPVGVILLVWSAMTLVSTIERSLNRIFSVQRSRSWKQRILFHWSAVTLGPLVLAGATYAGQKLHALDTQMPVLSWFFAAVGWAGPVVVGIVFVATLYKLMPNAEVGVASVLGGAVVAVLLWLLAKWGFSIYVQKLVGTRNLYGTLGLLPLFLIWLNASWWIFLFGAELAHSTANLERIHASELAENIALGATDLLAVAVAVAAHYHAGRGPLSLNQLNQLTQLPGECVAELLDRLCDNGIICQVGGVDRPGYVPARPLAQTSVLKVMELGEAAQAPQLSARYAEQIAACVSDLQRRAEGLLGEVTLADLAAAEPYQDVPVTRMPQSV